MLRLMFVSLTAASFLVSPALSADSSGCYRQLYSAKWLREHEPQTISDFFALYYDDEPALLDISLRRVGDEVWRFLAAEFDCKAGDGLTQVCTSCFGGGFTIAILPEDDAIEIDASRPYGFFRVAEDSKNEDVCKADDIEITTITAEEMPQPNMKIEGYFCRGAF